MGGSVTRFPPHVLSSVEEIGEKGYVLLLLGENYENQWEQREGEEEMNRKRKRTRSDQVKGCKKKSGRGDELRNVDGSVRER